MRSASAPARSPGPVVAPRPASRSHGSVLVVSHLDPRLAAVIPRLGGLVAETGNALSHLAILAREYGVPAVVGVADATRRFAGATSSRSTAMPARSTVTSHRRTAADPVVDADDPTAPHEQRSCIMNARRIGVLAAIFTLVASGAYVFIYLYRWEWNRAQVAAAIFIAVEIAHDRMDPRRPDAPHRPSPRRRSAWPLEGEQRRLHVIRTTATAAAHRTSTGSRAPTARNVFIPVLLGAGAVLSGLAWVVERVARATAGRAAERGLARDLGALDLPAGGLLDGGLDPLALLRGPRP